MRPPSRWLISARAEATLVLGLGAERRRLPSLDPDRRRNPVESRSIASRLALAHRGLAAAYRSCRHYQRWLAPRSTYINPWSTARRHLSLSAWLSYAHGPDLTGGDT